MKSTEGWVSSSRTVSPGRLRLLWRGPSCCALICVAGPLGLSRTPRARQGRRSTDSGTVSSAPIRIEGARIAEVGDLSPRQGEDLLDATGCVVTPGLINTHHHLFQSVMKGVPAGMNASLDDWLALVPYTLWPRLDEETLRISARIGLAELALSGATTVCDHHDIFSDLYDYDPADALHAHGGTVSMAVDGAAANEAADMGAALYSAFTVHRASKGVAAADRAVILYWATMGGARALGYPALGQIAPGKWRVSVLLCNCALVHAS